MRKTVLGVTMLLVIGSVLASADEPAPPGDGDKGMHPSPKPAPPPPPSGDGDKGMHPSLLGGLQILC